MSVRDISPVIFANKVAPYSEPAMMMLTFSLVYPCKKAFPILHAQQESPYNTLKKNPILTVSI
jgi:hypothetical protein